MSLLALTWNTARDDAPGLAPPSRAPLEFHRSLPGYRRTPLVDHVDIARKLGLRHVFVKVETERLGLPSFKILGVWWAVRMAIAARLGLPVERAATLAQLRDALPRTPALTLAAATDGNHGRAVARVARTLGMPAHVFVPEDMAEPRIRAIKEEGAAVTVVPGTYDQAVELAYEEASATCLVISDAAIGEHDAAVPRWVVEGYGTILWEAEEQLADRGAGAPAAVFVQMGVGGFASAVAQHFVTALRPGRPPAMVGIEPEDADCVRASIEAGKIVALPGPHRSIMSGLNCGTPSITAFPVLRGTVDACATISDDAARNAMRRLAAVGIVAGEAGAAGFAGLLESAEGGVLDALGIDQSSSVVVFVTEGATDPAAYQIIVGRPAVEEGTRETAAI
jgi:diaminopropionate ammonia-lyase